MGEPLVQALNQGLWRPASHASDWPLLGNVAAVGDSVTAHVSGLHIDASQPHCCLVAHCSDTLAIAGVAKNEIATQIVLRWPATHAAGDVAGTCLRLRYFACRIPF